MTGPDWSGCNIFDCWEENHGTNFLCVDQTTKALKIVHTSGGPDSHHVGMILELCADQSGRRLGNRWQIVAIEPHSTNGLRNLSDFAKIKSIVMATYK